MSALKKVDWKRTASAYFWITVGSILYGFAFDWFYTPNLIGYGGITGVGQVVNAFIPAIPIGMFVLVINIPLLSWGGSSSAAICWSPPCTPWWCPLWRWTPLP